MKQSSIWDNKPIGTTSLIKGMPIDRYHGQCCVGPSVSSTNLRRVLEVNGGSPAHFFAEWTGNPKRVESDEEPHHLVLGRAVHHLMLGEQMFSGAFSIRPHLWNDWRSAAARKWREAQEAAGRATLTPEDIRDIVGMAKSLRNYDMVQKGILRGRVERSLFWLDKESGLWCKARPDTIPTDSGDFCDLKTTTAVQYDDLARTVRKFGYHQQAALIAEGARIAADVEMSSFTFLFVEKKPPYCIRSVNLKPEDLALGHKQNRAARLLIARGIQRNHWPGPGDGHIVSISLGDRYRGIAASDVDNVYKGLEPHEK